MEEHTLRIFRALILGALLVSSVDALAQGEVRQPRGSDPARLKDAASESPKAPGATGGNPLWSVPLDRLSTTRDRPIFVASRRPPSVIAAQPPAAARPVFVAATTAPELPNIQLLGSVTGENQGVAVFLDERTKGFIRLKSGEGYAGWLLREINGREVVLEKDNHKLKLTLPSPMPDAAK